MPLPPRIRRSASRLAAAVTATVTVALAATTVHGQSPGPDPAEPVCPGLPVVVTVGGATAPDRTSACEGARDAIAFFAAHGLKLADRVRIRVTLDRPPGTSESAAGCFDESTGTVHLVPYERFRRFGTWFERPIDRAMYRSLATHEVAHAMSGCNFTPPRPTVQAKEYVAYVAMFETMAPALRDAILARYPDRGFESSDRLTPLLFMFDPMAFGVAAYRYHRRDDGGTAFLGRVMAGQAMTD